MVELLFLAQSRQFHIPIPIRPLATFLDFIWLSLETELLVVCKLAPKHWRLFCPAVPEANVLVQHAQVAGRKVDRVAELGINLVTEEFYWWKKSGLFGFVKFYAFECYIAKYRGCILQYETN